MALSRDGKTIASGSVDGTIKIWQMSEGKVLRTLPGQGATVTSVALSGDGRKLASVALPLITIKIWDVETGSELRVLPAGVPVISVALSDDGKTVVSGRIDGTVRLWDLETGRDLPAFRGHGAPVSSLALSVDGKTAISGNEAGDIRVWDLASGKELYMPVHHGVPAWCVALGVEAKTAISGCFDKRREFFAELKTLTAPGGGGIDNGIDVRIWDVETSKELRALMVHGFIPVSMALSADGKPMAATGPNKTIKVWEVSRANEVRSLGGDSSPVIALSLSADGKRAATTTRDKAGQDQLIKIWDLASGRELPAIETSGENNPVVALHSASSRK